MNRIEIENALNDLNQLVISGNLLEAFDKYYHDDVSMQENELPATVGKANNRIREEEFLRNVLEFRSAKAKQIAVGENVSYVTWSLDYTHKEWGVKNYTQVSKQVWKDGKIIQEQFVYGA